MDDATHTPWPLPDVLRVLADAAAHLLDAHNCDTDGHETIRACEQQARVYLTQYLITVGED